MRICLDSSVLIAHLGGDSSARDIIVKIVKGEWKGFINPIVASETMMDFSASLQVCRQGGYATDFLKVIPSFSVICQGFLNY